MNPRSFSHCCASSGSGRRLTLRFAINCKSRLWSALDTLAIMCITAVSGCIFSTPTSRRGARPLWKRARIGSLPQLAATTSRS